MKKEIDPVEILKVIVGVIIAIYFQQVLQRRFSYEANLRELLLKRVGAIEKRLELISQATNGMTVGGALSAEQQIALAPLFKALSAAVWDGKKILDHAGFGKASKQLSSLVLEMQACKEFLTGRDPQLPLGAADLGRCQQLQSAMATTLALVSIRVIEQGKAKKHRFPLGISRAWGWLWGTSDDSSSPSGSGREKKSRRFDAR